MENQTKIDTNITNKPALITDLDASYVSREVYSHARNIDSNTHEGNVGTLSNSMSNILCVELPYKFIGSASLNDGTHIVFSGDNINSEIGRVDENICTYTKIVGASCLNFKTNSPITGEAKKLENDDIVVTFRDDVNPVRRLNINRIPYIYTVKDDACLTKEFGNVLDCQEILLFPKISLPNIELFSSESGSLANGTYAVAIAYNVNGQKYSDYYSITNRIHLFNKANSNGLHVKLSNLDRGFDTFSLVVIQNSKGTRTTKIIGEYPTSNTDITVSDFDGGIIINQSELVVVKSTFEKAGIISANSNYLILADLTKRPELNYQKQAMDIVAEYTVEQVNADYYINDPKDIGYYRDENYDFGIQWLYDTGEWSAKTHIPGRAKKASDKQLASGIDVYEKDKEYPTCDEREKIEDWSVINTAGLPKITSNKFKCDRRIYAYGELGYYESTEKYPDNSDLFGEDACTPIRYHKFPDECKVSRYTNIEGKTYLNILGVRFKNIKHPTFEGKIVPGIVGYRIVRSDRKGGNKSVIARGLATNVRKYTDIQNNREVWYANYPYNDLSPDAFISSTQTVYKNKRERYFTPLTEYFNDKFNFYTPHGAYQPKYKMGGEFKIECEEIADVEGKFEPVFGHPKMTLLTQFAFWIAAATGIIESTLILAGKHTDVAVTKSGLSTGTAQPTYGDNAIQNEYRIESVEDLMGLDIVGYVSSQLKAAASVAGALQVTTIKKILNTVKTVLTVIASAGLKIPFSVLKGIQFADNILQIIYNFTGPTDYAYQYNSKASFNRSVCVRKDNKRRSVIAQPEYLSSNLHSIRGTTFNNYGKQESILIELNKPIEEPKNLDTTRNTITGFGLCKTPRAITTSQAVAFYATSKVNNLNQYGQLGSAAVVITHTNPIYINNTQEKFISPIVYGGDCIIAKHTVQTKHQFFHENLATTINNELPTNYPDNTPYDYTLYRNIGYPRFWADSTRYDFSQLLSKKIMDQSTFSKTTTSKYNLDCKFQDAENVFRVDNAFFYTSNNGVLDFYVECDYNISFREETRYPFYSRENTNVTEIFKAPFLWFPEEYKLDNGFKDIQTNEVFSKQLRVDFKDIDNKKLRNKNAVIYSLPSYNLQAIDNWQYFLPGNYFSFNQSDFGSLTGVHKIDQDRLIYLFDRSSPFVSTGRDEIQTLDGRKVTIGDGGMFAREPRELVPTDVNYGSSQSKYAFSANQFGYFYPSQSQGRLFNYSQNLDDLTRAGIYHWAKRYMPIQLFEKYPEMNKEENPLTSIGYHMAFDNNYEIVYFTKRDFIPKPEYESRIKYNSKDNNFSHNGTIVPLSSDYFDDVSWTISYSPKDKSFISWHDWHPDWVIQSENHFLTIKDNGIWKHNSTCESFCNYYGKDYPFEIEPVDSDGQNVMIRKSIEYFIEGYKYKNNCRDKFHALYANFDNLRVHNSEQMSPLLNVVKHPETKYGSIEYPKRNGQRYDVLFAKREQRYRINQFWDSVKDRGKFTKNEFHLWVNHPSGYKRIANPVAIDLNKEERQRKKFRHYFTKFLFSKETSGDTKFIFKFFNIKKDGSPS